MSLFFEKSYKSALKNTLLAKKSALGGSTWGLSRLAEHCKIQKTYLSRVFNSDAHLNSDQLFLAMNYLELSTEEQQFIELLHHWERSDIPKRKKQLQESLNTLRQQHTKTEKHLTQVSDLSNTKGADAYYLDANAQLVHLFLTIPLYAESPMLIAKKLGLSEENLKNILSTLTQLGLVSVVNNRLKVIRENVHLPNHSNWIKPYQILTRMKGLERLQNGSARSSYAYTLFFSANESTRNQIQARFFRFLQDLEKLVQPAKAEKVYQLHFDLIDWD